MQSDVTEQSRSSDHNCISEPAQSSFVLTDERQCQVAATEDFVMFESGEQLHLNDFLVSRKNNRFSHVLVDVRTCRVVAAVCGKKTEKFYDAQLFDKIGCSGNFMIQRNFCADVESSDLTDVSVCDTGRPMNVSARSA